MSRTKLDLLSRISEPITKARFINNNTLEIHYKDNSRAIRLHDTNILTFKDDTVKLDSGGWRTPTTKDRINEYSNLHIWQEASQWFVKVGSWQDKNKTYIFYDGITFDLKGKLLTEEKRDKSREIKEMKKRINKYVHLINKENIPQPSNGDCWFCLMTNTDGKALGDITKNNEHLLNHLDESCLHGSILINAMRETGYSDEQIGFHYGIKLDDTFKRSLRKYLQKRLLIDL